MKLEGKGLGGKGAAWAQKIVAEHRNVTQKGIKDVTVSFDFFVVLYILIHVIKRVLSLSACGAKLYNQYYH